MNIFFYKKKVIVLVLALFGISSLFLFQNCSEIKPLTSEGEFIPDPGDQGDGSGDNIGDNIGDNNGDGGDSGDTGGGNTSGTYDNSDPYKCDYNDDGVVDFETRTNGVANTSRPAGMELIQPQGFTMYQKTWSSLFNGRPFGTTTSYLAPIGSWSVRDAPGDSMYITVPFVLTENGYQKLTWRGSQSIPEAGYSVGLQGRRADDVLVSVSPCAGDIREKDIQSTGQWLRGCRVEGGSGGSLVFSDLAANSNCRLSLNKTYWLTIHMKVCQNGPGTVCEANFSYSP